MPRFYAGKCVVFGGKMCLYFLCFCADAGSFRHFIQRCFLILAAFFNWMVLNKLAVSKLVNPQFYFQMGYLCLSSLGMYINSKRSLGFRLFYRDNTPFNHLIFPSILLLFPLKLSSTEKGKVKLLKIKLF